MSGGRRYGTCCTITRQLSVAAVATSSLATVEYRTMVPFALGPHQPTPFSSRLPTRSHSLRSNWGPCDITGAD